MAMHSTPGGRCHALIARSAASLVPFSIRWEVTACTLCRLAKSLFAHIYIWIFCWDIMTAQMNVFTINSDKYRWFYIVDGNPSNFINKGWLYLTDVIICGNQGVFSICPVTWKYEKYMIYIHSHICVIICDMWQRQNHIKTSVLSTAVKAGRFKRGRSRRLPDCLCPEVNPGLEREF